MSATRVAEMLAGGVPYDVALQDHLRHNLYPPVPELQHAAVEAIDAVSDGRDDAAVELPSGQWVTAIQVVEGAHLQPFVDYKQVA